MGALTFAVVVLGVLVSSSRAVFQITPESIEAFPQNWYLDEGSYSGPLKEFECYDPDYPGGPDLNGEFIDIGYTVNVPYMRFATRRVDGLDGRRRLVGLLYLNTELDADDETANTNTRRQFRVACQGYYASEDTPVELGRDSTLVINDVNDNKPEFIRDDTPIFSFEVKEETPIGYIAYDKIEAYDKDSNENGQLTAFCDPSNSTANHNYAKACELFGLITTPVSGANSFYNGRRRYRVTVITTGLVDIADKQYSMKVYLKDEGVPPKVSTPVSVAITVGDIQNSPPEFFNAPFTFQLSENVPENTILIRLKGGTETDNFISAYDADEGDANPLEFFLLQDSEAASYFKLGPLQYFNLTTPKRYGVPLLVAKPLDFETLTRDLISSGDSISINIMAVEQVEPGMDRTLRNPMNATTPVDITILDVNDEAPIFSQDVYEFLVEEYSSQLQIRTDFQLLTGVIGITDKDGPSGNVFDVSIIAGNDDGIFELDSNRGAGNTTFSLLVRDTTFLDFEKEENVFTSLTLEAVDSDPDKPFLRSTAVVTFQLTDINDEQPVFTKKKYIFDRLPEDAPIGTIVGTIKATDADDGSNALITYSLEADDFVINATTGEISVAQPLDFENSRIYSLVAYASDNGSPTFQTPADVEIRLENVKDLGIRILGYFSATLDEETTELRPEIIIRAVDRDDPTAPITYEIVKVIPELQPAGFRLDPDTGVLSVIRHIDSSEADEADRLEVEVQACSDPTTPGGDPTCGFATVFIEVTDLNNHKPVVDPNVTYAEVNETAPVGTVVATLSYYDLDEGENGEVQFRILSGAFDLFGVTEDGAVVVSGVNKLNFEGLPLNYNVTIVAQDRGNPTKSSFANVIIDVLDNNDEDPIFLTSPYFFAIADDADYDATVTVGIVSATDPDTDSKMSYRIDYDTVEYLGDENLFVADLARNAFDVDSETGRVYVKGPLNSRVYFSRVWFMIEATDVNQLPRAPGTPGQQTRTLVYIDILSREDKFPLFSQPWTRDNNYIRILVHENPKTGWPLYTLIAYDQETLADIRHFEKVSGTDPEGYFQLSDNCANLVNSTCDVIVVRALDYEALPASDKTLIFGVKAISSISGLVSLAFLEVVVTDINDVIPKFSQQNYTFYKYEGLTAPGEIGNVVAFDEDTGSAGQVIFRIDGDFDNMFNIYTLANRGTIYLAPSKTLDFEERQEHTIYVYAQDNPGITGSIRHESLGALVTIKVLDLNDNSPIYDRDVYEFSAMGTSDPPFPVGVVQAEDKDRGQNGAIRYSVSLNTEGARYFDVTQALPGNFGRIVVRQSLRDLPENKKLTLLVVARDQGKPSRSSTATVIITVSTGSRDPNPKYDETIVKNPVFTIPEDTPVGTLVLTALAETQYGSNSTILYSFLKDNAVRDYLNFTIGTTSGEIRTAGLFDREKKDNYNLQLLASDSADIDVLTTQLLITVLISDVDDNKPSFKTCPDVTYPTRVPAFVEEGLPAGQAVYKARACDADLSPYSDITYQFDSTSPQCNQNVEDDFEVNPQTGQVYTSQPLDREKRDQYVLCVRAAATRTPEERDPNGDDVLYLFVTVMDQNDKGPKFGIGELRKVILEYPDVEVLVSEAVDEDLPPNNEVRYSLPLILFTVNGKSRENPKWFNINPSSGAISVGSSDYRAFIGGFFTLTVLAEDRYNGENVPRDTQTVKVFVAAKSQQIRVVFNQPAGEEVERKAQAMVTELNDLDTGVTYEIMKISYHIISNDEDPKFDRTDVCMVAVMEDTESVMNALPATQKLSESRSVINKYGAYDPGPCDPAKSVYPEGWESYWWVLVAFAIFIFLVTCILIFVVCVLYNHLKNYMKSKRTYLVPGSG